MAILDEPGDLAEVPLAAVLIEALNVRASGALVVDHGGGTSRVFLRAGIPVGAQSFKGFRPLGQALLADGVIDVEALGRSLAEMARTGRPQGEILVEMGAATRAQVDAALSRQQATYLTEIAGLSSGSFQFDAAAPIPAWTTGIRIRPLVSIVEALEKPQANALVIAALQPAAGGPVALAPSYGELADAFGFSEQESALVARLRAPITLDALFADAPVSSERARAILASLLLLGLAVSSSDPHAVDAVTGIVVDLAELAGEPVEPLEPVDAAAPPPAPGRAGSGDEPPLAYAPAPGATQVGMPAPSPPAAPAPPPRPARPLRRSDPEEARKRRQRLLQRAMQNMGVGPLSGQPPPAAARPAAPPPPGRRPPPTAAERDLRRALDAATPQARSPDLFVRLGVERGATRDQVKAAYFQLAKHLHPDRFASPALADLAPRVKDLFSALNEAYEVLSDDRKRAEYAARLAPVAGSGRDGDPGAGAIDFQKAEACARTRDFERARGFFEAALRAEPRAEYQAAYAAMLLAEPHTPDLARARALAQAALRDPTCERAAMVCGILARDDGDDDRAERLFRQALSRNPRNADAERELRALAARRRAKGSGPGGGRR